MNLIMQQKGRTGVSPRAGEHGAAAFAGSQRDSPSPGVGMGVGEGEGAKPGQRRAKRAQTYTGSNSASAVH